MALFDSFIYDAKSGEDGAEGEYKRKERDCKNERWHPIES